MSGDGTIVRVVEEDHDQDDTTPPIETRTPKTYRWDESRDRLLMTEWDYVEADWTVEYERVPNPIPSPPVGQWVREPDNPEEETTLWLTVRADGTLFYRSLNPGRWDFSFDAKWTHDPDNLFLLLTEVSEPAALANPDSILRIGYAATDTAGELLVSGWWQEEGTGFGYVPHRYGDYRSVFVPVRQ